jgi:hypothetical protein
MALLHQRKYSLAESRLHAAIVAAQSIHAPRSGVLSSWGHHSAAASMVDGASTVGASSIMSIDEEAKHLIYSMTLLLARLCHMQGRLQEAVRTDLQRHD